jgi:hypothetical protein
MDKKRFDAPDEVKSPPHTTMEQLNLPDGSITRVTFAPGWKWSTDIKPAAGTDSCQVHHIMYLLSGQMTVALEGGSQADIGAGDLVDLAPGHDAWVTSDVPVVYIELGAWRQ